MRVSKRGDPPRADERFDQALAELRRLGDELRKLNGQGQRAEGDKLLAKEIYPLITKFGKSYPQLRGVLRSTLKMAGIPGGLRHLNVVTRAPR